MSKLTSNLVGGTSDLQSALRAGQDGFPFRTELSLAPLIRFWTQAPDGASVRSALVRILGDELAKAPELLERIDDLAVITRQRDLIDFLMTAVFPPASWEEEYGAALIPFDLRGFYATPPMRRLLMSDDGALQGRVNLGGAMVSAMRVAYAYALILWKIYGIDVDVEYPLIFTVSDPETGLDRHFRLLFDEQFVDVVPTGPVPRLEDGVRQRLRADIFDPTVLRDALPAESFFFRGASILRAVEVTDEEVLSALKRDLIDKESIVSSTRFLGLQQRLRTFFRRPDLVFGLAALEADRVLVLNYGSRHEHSCVFADSAHYKTSDFAGSIYERTVKGEQPIIVEDLTVWPERTHIEDEIVKGGIRNLMTAPLHYQDEVIGTLELGSPHPGDLDATHLPKLQEILPLFAMAVQRSMEELNARIQTQIKEKFTAIHPVVEWRFRKAVLDSLERFGERTMTGGVEIDPIVFENVYPLYALSDIRGSSTQRALAIQSDLLTQLGLAKDVIETAHQARRLPALDELLYRLQKHVKDIEGGLTSGDEASVIAFLRSNVERLFDHLQDFGPEVRGRVEAYRSELDARLGVVYRQRRIFEESVTRIAETISSYLDLEEQAAQGIFPHYFEKQKTDGVDHQLYVGASLVEDGRFDPIYLKSLRLWQLMVTCGIAARVEQVAHALPVPLETTHLVLVQHAPLSIRFRFDEKRFDVDGAYDIRYEIVKKRIDKALVRGTSERVTQPGRIAVIYGHPAEATEYRGYLAYLRHLGYISGDVEDLELEELQGVHGLRALRVTVALRAPEADQRVSLGDLHTAVSAGARR